MQVLFCFKQINTKYLSLKLQEILSLTAFLEKIGAKQHSKERNPEVFHPCGPQTSPMLHDYNNKPSGLKMEIMGKIYGSTPSSDGVLSTIFRLWSHRWKGLKSQQQFCYY